MKIMNEKIFFGIFNITGNNVQGVGYRPFIMGKFPDYNLEGKVVNEISGYTITVSLYGSRKDIEKFRSYLLENIPKESEVEYISKVRYKKINRIPYQRIDTSTGYLILDQMGKFVEEGKLIREGIDNLPGAFDKSFAKYLKPIRVKKHVRRR